jgi:hypothetical protein
LAGQKKRFERTRNKLAQQETDLKNTVTPMLAKIDTIETIGTALLKSGYARMASINDFLDRLTHAADYFNNAGRLFHNAARKKHI